MDQFLTKFVLLVKHLLETSHKLQIVKSDNTYQTALFCSKLTSELEQTHLVINIDAQSFLNSYQQDFFLDWAADQFEDLLKKNQEKFDSPWLIIITQADLLKANILGQLLTLKHQRENAQLQLLFHFGDSFDPETFFSELSDPIITEKNYHIHSIPLKQANNMKDISTRSFLTAIGSIVFIVAVLFFYQPSSTVKKTDVAAAPTPAELFTDNSLGNWSDTTESKIEEHRKDLESEGEASQDNGEKTKLDLPSEADLKEQVKELEQLDMSDITPEKVVAAIGVEANLEEQVKELEQLDMSAVTPEKVIAAIGAEANLEEQVKELEQLDMSAVNPEKVVAAIEPEKTLVKYQKDLEQLEMPNIALETKEGGILSAVGEMLTTAEDKKSQIDSWSWQLIAFNSEKKAIEYKDVNCQNTCLIAKNKEYFVVLFGSYSTYEQGLLDKDFVTGIVQSPWLRVTDNLILY